MKCPSTSSISLLVCWLLLNTGCDVRQEGRQNRPANDNQLLCSDYQIEQKLIDSVSLLSEDSIARQVGFRSDSIFRNQPRTQIILSREDFNRLKHGSMEGGLEKEWFVNTLKESHLDNIYDQFETIPVKLRRFSPKDPFEYFAIEVGGENWENCLYFFQRNILIAKHRVVNKYGVELDYFHNGNDAPVIFYLRQFQSGTGIWWYNYNFYKYIDNELVPVLNELQNSNVGYPWNTRGFWYESKIIDTDPLTFSVVSRNELTEQLPHGTATIPFRSDSSIVTYRWNEAEHSYQTDPGTMSLHHYQALSHYLEPGAQSLFIRNYRSELKKILCKGDSNDVRIISSFLDVVKEDLKIKPSVRFIHGF